MRRDRDSEVTYCLNLLMSVSEALRKDANRCRFKGGKEVMALPPEGRQTSKHPKKAADHKESGRPNPQGRQFPLGESEGASQRDYLLS